MDSLTVNRVLPPILNVPLALVPIVPLVVFVAGIVAWLDSLDELQRRIHPEATLVQFGATGILYGVRHTSKDWPFPIYL